MPGARFSCFLCDPYGVRLGDVSNFISLKYTRIVNDISTATIVLPYLTRGQMFNAQLIRAPDGRLEIWRKLPGFTQEQLETETTWLIKKVDYDRDDHGRATIIIEADTPLSLLREPGRFVNYDADSVPRVTGTADNLCKAIVLDNAGTDATDTTRSLFPYLTVQPSFALAPSLTKAMAWRDVLKTLQEIAAATTQAGTYLAFDIVAPTPDTLEFRTYVGQRGVDHRFPNGISPIIIAPEFGNMGECTLSYDWRNEITYAKAGGRGEGAQRLTATSQDSTRIAASPFGLREKFVNATMYTTTTGLAAEADATVRAGRPKTIFRGKILDAPGSRYGIHWSWGDYVTVQAFGQSFDARIEAITVTVARGKETIDAWVRSDT